MLAGTRDYKAILEGIVRTVTSSANSLPFLSSQASGATQGRPWQESQRELLFGRMPPQCSFTSGSARPQWELTGWSNSPKDGGRSGKDTMYFSYSNKHHGKAKAMEMTGLWGQRVALSQGWPWQTLLKPRATTTLRLHGTHS